MPEIITRILIADDHEVVRRGIRQSLQGHSGVEVVGEASNGEEAIQRALELQPDMIIMDISMLMLHGFNAAEIIKKYRPQTSIVVFSMYSYDGLPDSVKKLGLDGFVSKGNNATALLNAIDAVQHNEKYFHN
jgi:DNA-binding NarL/FixJ family response regulator